MAPGVIRDHCVQFSNMAGMPRSAHEYFKVVWFAFVWIIWKERNHRIFNNTMSDPSSLADKVKLNFYLWLKSKQSFFHYSYHDWWKHSLPCMCPRVIVFVFSVFWCLRSFGIDDFVTFVCFHLCTPCAG